MNTADAMRQINARVAGMRKSWEQWRAHWAEIQEYTVPMLGEGLSGRSYSEASGGEKKHGSVYNGAAEKAVSTGAAGMQSGVTNPAKPWFRLGVSDPELRDRDDIKEWLYAVTDRILSVLNKGGFYRATNAIYEELFAFCTAAFAILDDPENVIYCRPYTCGEYMLATDSRGKVDTFYRETWMTASQLMQKFGRENLSDTVRLAYDQGNLEQAFEVCNLIERNDDRIEEADARGMPFRSIYWEKTDSGRMERFLGVRGFQEFPVMAPRWSVKGVSVYGKGPGMMTLADVKMLQKMERKGLIALDKVVDPPIAAPDGLKTAQVNTYPGGLTYSDSVTGQHGLRPLYQINPPLGALETKIQNVVSRIQQGFFNDLFLLIVGAPVSGMTATEVVQRHEEKLLMLGPVLERVHSELCDPAIERVFGMLLRGGMLPEIPDDLRGKDLNIEYISMLAQAQKLMGANTIHQFLGVAGNMASVQPEVLDGVNFDEALKKYADIVNLDPEIMRSEDEVAAIRQQRAEQAAAQQAAQTAMNAAQGAKTLSEADMTKNNALTLLTGRPTQ